MESATAGLTRLTVSLDDPDKLLDSLQRIPFSSLTNDQCEMIINWILKIAIGYENKKAIRTIILTVDEIRLHMDSIPLITTLFLNDGLDEEEHKYIFSCFPEKTGVDYFMDLINSFDDAKSVRIASKITDYFTLSTSEWDLLYHLTDDVEDEEYRNQFLRMFLFTKVAELQDELSKPSWIGSYNVGNVEPMQNKPMPSHQAIHLMTKNFTSDKIKCKDGKTQEDIKIKADEIKSMLLYTYSIATSKEKEQMLADFTNISIDDDTDIFRKYGPVNITYSECNDRAIDDICEMYGGCRMFLCNEFETIDRNGDDIDIFLIEEHRLEVDWYRGTCDKCLKSIPKRIYAVREPLIQGGWRGCYCSFNCVREIVKDNIMLQIVNNIENQLNKIGISDI